MSLKTLSFETLKDVDFGAVQVAFDRALRGAVLDVLDRKSTAAVRSVTLTVKVSPSGPESDYVDVACEISTKHPGKSTTVPMRISQDGLRFQSDAPDNPDQPTLLDKERS